MITKNLKIEQLWIIFYVAAIFVMPAIRFHGKFIFLSEILLLPAVCFGIFSFKKQDLKSPLIKSYFSVIAALLLAYFCGKFRGELGHEVTVYDWSQTSDSFKPVAEGIKFIRWSLMFSTPVLVGLWLRNLDLKEKFLTAVIVFGGLSSALCLLDAIKILDLSPIYSFNRDINWLGRAYGTFPSPLEASLAYAFVFGATLLKSGVLGRFVRPISLAAIVVTHSATGVLVAGVIWFAARLSSQQVLGLLPLDWLHSKFGNLTTRILMWKKWLVLCLSHPHFFLVGMGFTQLVVDNSYLMFFVYGGVFLGVSVWFYFSSAWKFSQWQTKIFLAGWFVSWLSLDSVGYWGMGRLCWLLLGLNFSQSLGHLPSAHPPSATKAQDL